MLDLCCLLILHTTGCDEKVKMVDVRFHVRYVCVKRMVACRFDYCSAVFPLFQRGEHEHSDCKHFYARERVLSLVGCVICAHPFASSNNLAAAMYLINSLMHICCVLYLGGAAHYDVPVFPVLSANHAEGHGNTRAASGLLHPP